MRPFELPSFANFQVRDYYIHMVCALLDNGVTPADVMSKSRLRHICAARHLVVWALYDFEHLSLTTISRMMDLNHASISKAVKKVRDVERYPLRDRDMGYVITSLKVQ